MALIFSDAFAAIAPDSVAPFTLAQRAGLVVGVLLTLAHCADAGDRADDRDDDVAVPHSNF